MYPTNSQKGILHVSHKSDPTISREKARLETILDSLKRTYSSRIGFEFEHIPVSFETIGNPQKTPSSDVKPPPFFFFRIRGKEDGLQTLWNHMKDGPLQRRKRVRIIQLFKICWLI